MVTKNRIGYWLGKKLSLETRHKMSVNAGCPWLGKKLSKEHIKKISLSHMGEKSSNWKGGISITKRQQRLYRTAHKFRKRSGKPVDLKTLQLIYENNIKKYGTLTCYLCGQSIPFGKDSIDHRTPISRGGDNQYDNLAIVCISCNHKKFTLTEQEYRAGRIPKEYPKEFSNSVRENSRIKYGHKCQLCGVAQMECCEQLHVHHIDYNIENNTTNNLIPLCRSCHSKVNHKREYWSNYFKERSMSNVMVS